MSHTAHTPRHRKPSRAGAKRAIASSVAGGVLSTLAVTGAAGPANASEPVTETIEMPTLTSELASFTARSATATQTAADAIDVQARQAQQDAAATQAAKDAKKAHTKAEKAAEEARQKAEAAAEAREAAAKEAAAERASRSEARTTLSAAAPASNGSGTSAGSSSDSGSSSVASGSAAAVVAFAKAQIGDAYVSGGTGPNSWDCSGLVQAAYQQAGVSLPRVSQSQSTAGTQVGLDNLQPGDILYWGSAGSAYHTAIYVGGGQFVGAQNPGTGTVQASLDYDPPTGAVRVL
ncbi:C40 family peptidase [Streptomyces sp. NPDC060194]|uniref:C40 family peptidase n=1 Tax=Streptomyces sp. NPDC060194 TaxID=3347069 RepID=UPI0036598D6F